MLSAYFRDIAHKKNMLELLHDRDLIQQEARSELKHRFAEFDIELVDVLIGKPETVEKTGEIETLLQQLRLRQLSREQIQTFEQQRQAAEKLQTLRMAQAQAEKQTELTNSHMEIEIAANRGEAELSQARRRADQTIVTAEADARRQVVLAEAEAKRQVLAAEAEAKRQLMVSEAESKARALVGEGEARKITAEGEAEADVLRQKVASYGDPRLYALALVTQHLAQSQQPLVPQHLFVTGGKEGAGGSSMLSTLLTLLVADRAGFAAASQVPPAREPDVVPAGTNGRS
jgi:regulator of protease activity HflC (stomatin/prohibitin superfamily)